MYIYIYIYNYCFGSINKMRFSDCTAKQAPKSRIILVEFLKGTREDIYHTVQLNSNLLLLE